MARAAARGDDGQGGMMGSGILVFPAIQSPHISLPAEKLFGIGPLNVTNSMLTMFIVMIGLVLFFAYATRRLATGGANGAYQAPHGAQNFAETVVELLLNLAQGSAGRNMGRRMLPLVATIFIFVLTANYAGLLPGVGTIGRCEHEISQAGGEHAASSPGCSEGEVLVPFLRAPNADFNMTIAMALVAIIVVQFQAIKAHGAGAYLKELFLAPPIPLLHFIGEVARIISLSARLFGNVFGGEVLLTVIIALTVPLFGLLGLVPAVFYGLETFFGFVQALLFSLLTLSYISIAASGHDEHEEHGVEGAIERGAQELAVGASD
jgi:F-type H+-transporting ATPase subunit a